MRRTYGRRAGIALATGLLVVTAACGSDKSADGGPEDAAAGEKPTGTAIKIGFVAPSFETSDSARGVAKAWAESVNAAGGINGHSVSLVIRDSKGEAAGASSAVKQLVENDKVVAVVLADSVTDTAVAPYLKKSGIPVLNGAGANPAVWSGNPGFFTTFADPAVVVPAGAAALVAAGSEKPGYVYCSEFAACSANEAPTKAAIQGAGGSYAGGIPLTVTTPDFTPQCLSLKERGADGAVLSIAGPASDSVRFMKTCKQQGLDLIYSTPALSPKDYRAVPDTEIAGTILGFPWWSKAPAVVAAMAAINKYAAKENPEGAYVQTNVWSALALFQKVATGIRGSVTPESVMAGYFKVKDETLDGLLAQPVSFTEGKPSPALSCQWQYLYDTNDDDPTTIVPTGAAGNGAEGDLASICPGS